MAPRERFDNRSGARVLPHNRVVHGFAGSAIPDHGCLALICNSDGRDIGHVGPGTGNGVVNHLAGVVPNLQRVVLHPARLRENLCRFFLSARDLVRIVVEQDRPSARCPIVDGENVTRHKFTLLTDGLGCTDKHDTTVPAPGARGLQLASPKQ